MDLNSVKARARKATGPLKVADPGSEYWGNRTNAGRSLPPYYLVYFLLVDLLNFRDLGRSEKIAFSIPIKINNTTLMIEYRKFGLGIFVKDSVDEVAADKAAKFIRAGVEAAQPYFESLASAAAKGSSLNVRNNAGELFERFTFFAECYASKIKEAEERKDERIRTKLPQTGSALSGYSITFPSYDLSREARWYGTAAIEAFFSWTEHVFILIAILQGKIATGDDIAIIAGIEWKEKFKKSLDISDALTKKFYDQLTLLRSQVRNFVAHGAFGKNGEALSFHSSVGAVPLILPSQRLKKKFIFGNGIDFLLPEAIKTIQDFISHMWSGDLSPAKIYIETGLPLILSYVINGRYNSAMISDETMEEFTHFLGRMVDDAANMDW
ncbi:hypothetical protein [Plastoroseomonas arctica]|uniref:Uncharacterized protein n=1 Tax=Plastoroseomonas arctica TaxID=1509237 RepID=A0AAF1KQH3_9PROT|nr:hypothetical protein [Plastoroseomonas arctica]MBR0653532.1 hypothetical protein [Plastoroseomonas arctica]